jgi:polyribonucleotide nucleotidyltransferase
METIEIQFHGKTISFETGKVAKQAGGAVIVRCGDSVVLVTACGGARKDGDFLPLSVEYLERTYAAGKIPGGFFKREGKLSERETLVSRLIDRPCRPLFPEGFYNEVQVVATVLSADGDNDTDVLAVCGASAALCLSELPFEGPLAGVRVARINGKLVINPSYSELTNCDLNFVVAGTKDAIVMVEGGAEEVPESEVLDALFFAHQELQALIQLQLQLQAKAGRKKMAFTREEGDKEFIKSVEAFLAPRLKSAVRIKDKLARRDEMGKIRAELDAQFLTAEVADKAGVAKKLAKIFEDAQYHTVRAMVFDEGIRIDGRDTTTVRPISVEVGVLPRTHGSALFTRGETQGLVISTIGTTEEIQHLDNLFGETSKSFMLHYNFPSYSVGETKPMRGPGRREIGHGALAERAVKMVMPSEKEFPYVVRVVSEIMESNGSTSMASVCGASLSLMDAGVPLKAPVAGVAMGLMKEGDKFVVLTDILGDEDHLGDMDFKVCGTTKGITAIQMDIKIKGLDKAIMTQALQQALAGRLFILDKMNALIKTARTTLNKFAPKIVSFKINPDKIRDVIGPGGKMIRSITESCGVKIEVTDDGTVKVSSNDDAKIKHARDVIQSLVQEAVIGQIYRGVVKRIADFGAFVEILPGTDGLVHISQLAEGRVRQVTDVVQEGDEVQVKVLDIDRQGKIRLSLKDALAELAGGGAVGA